VLEVWHPKSGHRICVAATFRPAVREEGGFMLILGLILLILGFVLGSSILWTIGIILLLVGAVLFILGSTGRAVGGRRHWY
jgi:Zn-dependent membrane protease YugP